MISNLHDSIYGNEENLVPKLIYNNYNQKVKVLREITQCLSICDTFSFSIAFISDSGLSSLRQTLLDLESKNIKGRIITSTYLNFNSPKMFEQLLEFKNIDVRVNMNEGFHPKGYIFEKNDEFRVLIGSSNLTQNAFQLFHLIHSSIRYLNHYKHPLSHSSQNMFAYEYPHYPYVFVTFLLYLCLE